jgi:hypothetical protein
MEQNIRTNPFSNGSSKLFPYKKSLRLMAFFIADQNQSRVCLFPTVDAQIPKKFWQRDRKKREIYMLICKVSNKTIAGIFDISFKRLSNI